MTDEEIIIKAREFAILKLAAMEPAMKRETITEYGEGSPDAKYDFEIAISTLAEEEEKILRKLI